MRTEVITKRDDLLIRRQILEPGQAGPWHTDPCHRFSVVVSGTACASSSARPASRSRCRCTRGWRTGTLPSPVSTVPSTSGTLASEEVVSFYLDPPGIEAQPEAP